MDFDRIDDAFHYVSNAAPGERSAVLRRSSGEVYLASQKAGFDERPPGCADDPDCLAIPHRQDLDPGKALFIDFIRSHAPELLARVEALFERPGAFRNVKDLFKRQGLLESWQVYESGQLEVLLRQWCSDQHLPL